MRQHCRSVPLSLAIVNGRVWSRPEATSIAIDGDRISHLGTGYVAADRVLNAAGAWILPAFNDAHVHFLMGSRSLSELDLFGARTQAEVENRVMAYARASGADWVVGRGWFYSAFPGAMPTVELLDRLIPDRPAFVESFDAHTGWANSRALAIAGASSRDVLKESEMETVTRHIPRPSLEQDLQSLRSGMRLAASRGIVSIQEAGDGQNQLELWKSLSDAGELTLRVRLAFDMTPGQTVEDLARRLDIYEDARGDGAWISTGILKAFADGVVESHTASMLEPYANAPGCGSPLWKGDELREAVRLADSRGWQVQVHAIGDAAIRQALDAFEGTSPGRRHRVEHIEVPHPDDVPRFSRLGVIASMQPQHADPDLTDVWRTNLGPERAGRGWPWRALRQAGARLAFGTDWPVVPLDPAASLRRATREMSLDDAIAAWTSGSAYAEFADRAKGALQPGMLADVVVVDLDASTVKATIAGGRVVYEG